MEGFSEECNKGNDKSGESGPFVGCEEFPPVGPGFHVVGSGFGNPKGVSLPGAFKK